jgi:hypothetical protein
LDNKLTSITVAQARKIAKTHALADLVEFVAPAQEVLDVKYLGAENC